MTNTQPALNRRPRTGWKTATGILLTALMLFPVYWMLNVSLTRDQDMRKSPPDLFPARPTLEGYRAVIDQQLPYLTTSLIIAASESDDHLSADQIDEILGVDTEPRQAS